MLTLLHQGRPCGMLPFSSARKTVVPADDETLLAEPGVVAPAVRTRQDLRWAIVFGAFLVSAYALGGGVAVASQKSEYKKCAAVSRKAASDAGLTSIGSNEKLRQAQLLLLVSVPAAVAMGYALISVLRTRPRIAVKAACIWLTVVMCAIGFWNFSLGLIVNGSIFVGVALWNAYCIYTRQKDLELCAHLFSTAAVSLRENGHLVSMSLALCVIMCAAMIPTIYFIFAAMQSGSAQWLYDSTYCKWNYNFLGYFTISVVGAALAWTNATIFEMRLFITAHVISRWYFLPAGTGLPGAPIWEATKLCGPAFGSLCLGGLVMTAIEVIRELVDRMQRGYGPLALLAGCFAKVILRLMENLTRFATIRVANTGEAFIPAARGATALFTSAGVRTWNCWAIPPVALGAMSLAIAVTYGTIITIIFLTISGKAVVMAELDLAFLVWFGTTAVVFLVLSFLSSILLNVIDTLYYCYATDNDTRRITRSEVHALFAQVPNIRPGAVVQQPDGELGYAPSTPNRVAAPVAPSPSAQKAAQKESPTVQSPWQSSGKLAATGPSTTVSPWA